MNYTYTLLCLRSYTPDLWPSLERLSPSLVFSNIENNIYVQFECKEFRLFLNFVQNFKIFPKIN